MDDAASEASVPCGNVYGGGGRFVRAAKGGHARDHWDERSRKIDAAQGGYWGDGAESGKDRAQWKYFRTAGTGVRL